MSITWRAGYLRIPLPCCPEFLLLQGWERVWRSAILTRSRSCWCCWRESHFWGPLVSHSFIREAWDPGLGGVTLFHVLDDPEGLPRCPSSHGDMVLRGSAGGEGVHRRGVAQSLALRNCKRSALVNYVWTGKSAPMTHVFPKCSMASTPEALDGYVSTTGSKVTLGKETCCAFPNVRTPLKLSGVLTLDGNPDISKPRWKHQKHLACQGDAWALPGAWGVWPEEARCLPEIS